MVKFKALQSAIELDSKNLKPQNDALDDALESKLIMLLKENPNLTQKEMIERISVSRATVQRLIKKLVIENKVERIGGKRYAIGGLMNNVCDGK
ncbi:MAG: HTH domain-containing protein [Lachnospiraceae bacterium]|nr:HTH domain-containing protein [Lachnospiraceae bacterium]